MVYIPDQIARSVESISYLESHLLQIFALGRGPGFGENRGGVLEGGYTIVLERKKFLTGSACAVRAG